MTPRNVDAVDLVVVGAGPVGLFAAFYAGLRGLDVTIVDSLSEPGGQVTALYPEKVIRDVAGMPSVRGRDLVDSLLRQVEPFRPAWKLGCTATTLTEAAGGYTIGCTTDEQIHGRSVVVTGGIGTFAPRPLTGTEAYLGRGVSYFVRNPEDLRGQRVVIVGGGDSAFDWADTLHEVAAEVVVVHRRARFRAHQDTVDRVRGRGVRIIVNSHIQALDGDPTVRAALVADTETGAVSRIDCDHVVAALGFVANLGPLAQWGLTFQDRKIVVDQSMRTNRPGLFAAGDICTYPGRVPLIAVGFGEAATAVNHAAVCLDPGSSAFPGHSTDGHGAQPVGAAPAAASGVA